MRAVIRNASGGRPLVAAGLIALTCALAAWLRLPNLVRDTLWAEDGRNFLQAALDSGPLNSLFIPYAGYLQAVPRLVASVTVQVVSPLHYAQAMTVGACIVAGVVAFVVFTCSREVLRWMPARVVIALLTVLAPLAPREVLGNQANAHSLIFWGLFWMLLSRPRTRLGSYALAVFALVGTLSEIQAVFLLPLLLWHPADRARWWPRACYLIGVCVQVCVTLLWPRGPSGNSPVGVPSMVYGFLINGVVPLWIPQKSIGPAMAWGGIGLCLALSLPFIAAFALCLWRGTAVQRVTSSGLASGAVIVYCAAVIENPQSAYHYATMSGHQLDSLWLSRYGVVPSMMLCALIPLAAAVVIDRLPAWRRVPARVAAPAPTASASRTRRTAAWSAVAIMTALLLVQFVPQSTVRSHGPAWQPQIAALSETCEQLPDSTPVRVKETIGWHVDVRCSLLE